VARETEVDVRIVSLASTAASLPHTARSGGVYGQRRCLLASSTSLALLPTLGLADHDPDHWARPTSDVQSIMRRHIERIDYIHVIGNATIIVSLSVVACLLLSV
jgi:hypothetical protein